MFPDAVHDNFVKSVCSSNSSKRGNELESHLLSTSQKLPPAFPISIHENPILSQKSSIDHNNYYNPGRRYTSFSNQKQPPTSRSTARNNFIPTRSPHNYRDVQGNPSLVDSIQSENPFYSHGTHTVSPSCSMMANSEPIRHPYSPEKGSKRYHYQPSMSLNESMHQYAETPTRNPLSQKHQSDQDNHGFHRQIGNELNGKHQKNLNNDGFHQRNFTHAPSADQRLSSSAHHGRDYHSEPNIRTNKGMNNPETMSMEPIRKPYHPSHYQEGMSQYQQNRLRNKHIPSSFDDASTIPSEQYMDYCPNVTEGFSVPISIECNSDENHKSNLTKLHDSRTRDFGVVRHNVINHVGKSMRPIKYNPSAASPSFENRSLPKTDEDTRHGGSESLSNSNQYSRQEGSMSSNSDRYRNERSMSSADKYRQDSSMSSSDKFYHISLQHEEPEEKKIRQVEANQNAFNVLRNLSHASSYSTQEMELPNITTESTAACSSIASRSMSNSDKYRRRGGSLSSNADKYSHRASITNQEPIVNDSQRSVTSSTTLPSRPEGVPYINTNKGRFFPNPDNTPISRNTSDKSQSTNQPNNHCRLEILKEIGMSMEMRQKAKHAQEDNDYLFWMNHIEKLNKELDKLKFHHQDVEKIPINNQNEDDEKVALKNTSAATIVLPSKEKPVSILRNKHLSSIEKQTDKPTSILKNGQSRRKEIRIRAPSDLAEGHVFTVKVKGENIQATVVSHAH